MFPTIDEARRVMGTVGSFATDEFANRLIYQTGDGAPTSTPSFIGERYLDETNNIWYQAVGVSSSADWKGAGFPSQSSEVWFLGEGTYEFDEAITLGSTVKVIVGIPGKTTIKCTAAMQDFILVSGDGTVLKDLIIDGNSLAQYGIRLNGDNFTCKDVTITKTTDRAVYGTETTGSQFIRVKCTDARTDNPLVGGQESSWFYHNFYFDNGEVHDLLFEDCEGDMQLKANGAPFDNVVIRGGKYNGPKMGIELLAGGGYTITNFVVEGGTEFVGSGWNAQVSLNEVNGFSMSDFFIDGVDNSTIGLEIVACERGTIGNFTVTECTRNILVTGATTKYVTFHDFVSNNASSNNFFAQNADHITVDGMIIAEQDAAASGVQFTNCDYVICVNCDLYGSGSPNGLKGIYIEVSANHYGFLIDNIICRDFYQHFLYIDATADCTIGNLKVGQMFATGVGAGIWIDPRITLADSSIPDHISWNRQGSIANTTIANYESHPSAGMHRTVLKFENTPITLTDVAGVVAYGSVKMYDFPDGVIQVDTVVSNLTITKSSAGVNDDWDGDFSVGSVAAAGDATLTGTEADMLPSTATPTASSGSTTAKGHTTSSETGLILDGTSTAADMYLNFLVDDADHDVTSTPCNLIANGTVYIHWKACGDY